MARFIVAYGRGRKKARLHLAQGCYRARTRGFLDFEFLAEDQPRAEAYDDFCRLCWRTGFAEDVLAGTEEVEVQSTGSSSSSSSG